MPDGASRLTGFMRTFSGKLNSTGGLEKPFGEEQLSSAGVRGGGETGSCRNYGLYILKYRKVNNNFYPKKGFGYATMTSPKERGCHFFYNYYMW